MQLEWYDLYEFLFICAANNASLTWPVFTRVGASLGCLWDGYMIVSTEGKRERWVRFSPPPQSYSIWAVHS